MDRRHGRNGRLRRLFAAKRSANYFAPLGGFHGSHVAYRQHLMGDLCTERATHHKLLLKHDDQTSRVR